MGQGFKNKSSPFNDGTQKIDLQIMHVVIAKEL